MQLRRAQPRDAPALTSVAFAAKRHWDYPESWIERWAGLLTITADYVATNPTFVATGERGEIFGFAALREAAGEWWLDQLWVVPAAMGRGMGRRLFEHCAAEARLAGATVLKTEADPHAEAFYARMGMHAVERVAAAMDGVERFLPIMEKPLG